MVDALCRRAPEVASARRVAERCMVLLVVVGNNVEIYSLLGEWLLLLLQLTNYCNAVVALVV